MKLVITQDELEEIVSLYLCERGLLVGTLEFIDEAEAGRVELHVDVEITNLLRQGKPTKPQSEEQLG